jgi:alanine racemase
MRSTKAIINLKAIQHNLSIVRQFSPQRKIMAVIKADAYGHGIVPVAQSLGDADLLAVACMYEAIKLRNASINSPILLLEGFFDQRELSKVVTLELDTVIHQQKQVQELLDFANRYSGQKKIKVWLKLDTGMNRLGFNKTDFLNAYKTLSQCPLVDCVNLMSHFACADDINNSMNQNQVKLFKAASLGLKGELSMANSAGIIAWPESHFDWVRPGIALFGCSPLLGYDGLSHQLKPAMTLQSQLITIKQLKAGDTVGYGASWKADKNTRIGIVAIGYGDGYPRHAKENTPVWINGSTYPLVGKVSMDMLAVNLGNETKLTVGDKVILWGDNLPVETIAEHSATIAYTLLCGVTSRVKFEYSSLDE